MRCGKGCEAKAYESLMSFSFLSLITMSLVPDALTNERGHLDQPHQTHWPITSDALTNHIGRFDQSPDTLTRRTLWPSDALTIIRPFIPLRQSICTFPAVDSYPSCSWFVPLCQSIRTPPPVDLHPSPVDSYPSASRFIPLRQSIRTPLPVDSYPSTSRFVPTRLQYRVLYVLRPAAGNYGLFMFVKHSFEIE